MPLPVRLVLVCLFCLSFAHAPVVGAQPPRPTPPSVAKHDLGYVPILMYHYIRTVDEQSDPLGFRLSVTPERFDDQMAYLKENGYTPVRMDTLTRCLVDGARCPERPVALTFDDGYADAATAALPILVKYGFVGTFYIIVNSVGTPGFLSWEQVRQLRDSGMEIGAHTLTHSDLAALAPEQARREIAFSRLLLQWHTGESIESFSYPAGSYTPAVAAMAQKAGFTNAVTTKQQSQFRRVYELSRRRVLGGEALSGFPWYLAPLE